ncbi:aminopeptidase P family N-terminal domain-containing protein, partial [Klebsiella pneumoniae]|nr:aminopeptidase P family N-terminal domain-containing protein [Klebsiella pneumoniae]
VAWLLNLRGASIPCNPVFPAYVIVTPYTTALFVDPRLIRQHIRTYLAKLQVSVCDYDAVWRSLREADYERVLVDVHASYALVHAAGEDRT